MRVFIGYPTGIKGYRLYDLSSKQIFVSQDMVFHESIFPFQSYSPTEHLIDPFPDLVLPVSSLDLPTSFAPPTDSQSSVQSSPSPISQSLQPVDGPLGWSNLLLILGIFIAIFFKCNCQLVLPLCLTLLILCPLISRIIVFLLPTYILSSLFLLIVSLSFITKQ